MSKISGEGRDYDYVALQKLEEAKVPSFINLLVGWECANMRFGV